MPLAERDEAGGVRHDGGVEMKIMIHEVMFFWRRVVRVVGGWAGKKQLTKLRYLLVALGRAPDIPARLKKLRYLLVALGRAPDIPARIL